MDSSDKETITQFQREFLEAFFEQTQAFFLTGGTALSGFYLHHRYSQDIDLFTVQSEVFAHIPALILQTAQRMDAKLTTIQTEPMVRRYLLSRGEESIIVDGVKDIAVQIVQEKPKFGNVVVDSLEDICSNKICAIVGRGEIKDYIDLYFLHQHGYTIQKYLPFAQQKDTGVSKATIAYVLSEVKFLQISDYMVKPLSIEELQAFFQALSDELALDCFADTRR
ncbi:nucleotidyl transferase AbiEii/AbiGii toxin family protein [Candidatus Poribacteria bacterium]|nr:nucleotidyl transferase AbiEii/AbiGii toxin family protein [Candidatus Poribacteria bacterium]